MASVAAMPQCDGCTTPYTPCPRTHCPLSSSALRQGAVALLSLLVTLGLLTAAPPQLGYAAGSPLAITQRGPLTVTAAEPRLAHPGQPAGFRAVLTRAAAPTGFPSDPRPAALAVSAPTDSFAPLAILAGGLLGASGLIARRPRGLFQAGTGSLREVALVATASRKKKQPSKSAKAPTAKPKTPPVDSKVLLRRSEKEYQALDEMYGGQVTDTDVVFTEMVVAVRSKPGTKVEPTLFSWVPICSIGVAATEDVHQRTRKETLVACLCREIGEALSQSSPSLRTFPRAHLEYSVEPMGSWDTFVFDRKGYGNDTATFAELGLKPGADARAIKTAYRRLAAELHPDRHGHDPVAQEANTIKMRKVQEAYRSLGGGYGEAAGCWYENLGGRARTDFSGALDLSQEKMAGRIFALEMPFEMGGMRIALAQLETSIPQQFMAANAMRYRLSLKDDEPAS